MQTSCWLATSARPLVGAAPALLPLRLGPQGLPALVLMSSRLAAPSLVPNRYRSMYPINLVLQLCGCCMPKRRHQSPTWLVILLFVAHALLSVCTDSTVKQACGLLLHAHLLGRLRGVACHPRVEFAHCIPLMRFSQNAYMSTSNSGCNFFGQQFSPQMWRQALCRLNP